MVAAIGAAVRAQMTGKMILLYIIMMEIVEVIEKKMDACSSAALRRLYSQYTAEVYRQPSNHLDCVCF